RQHAGIAEEQIKPKAEQAPDKHPTQQVGACADQGGQERCHAKHDTGNDLYPIAATHGAGWQGAGALARCVRSCSALDRNRIIRLAHALPSTPNRPCGRKISTSAMAANSMTSE